MENIRLAVAYKCQNIYYVWDLKIIHLNINSTSQIVQTLLGELRSKGTLIFQEKPAIGCLLAISGNETLSPN